LNVPLITYVRELSVDSDNVTASRDIEAAIEKVKAKTPLVVSVTSEINKPRRAPLTQILRASRKPLNMWKLADLSIDAESLKAANSTIQVVNNLAPQQERKGIIFEGDVDESIEKLIVALRKEGVVT